MAATTLLIYMVPPALGAVIFGPLGFLGGLVIDAVMLWSAPNKLKK